MCFLFLFPLDWPGNSKPSTNHLFHKQKGKKPKLIKIFIDFQSKELLDVIFWGPVSINRLRGGDGGWRRGENHIVSTG